MLGVFLFWVGCPLSHGWHRASVSAAASGAVCQWQTSSTDRRGSRDRPLGNVPPGRSAPQGGSQVCALPKACAKPSLASPLGGGETRVSEDGGGKVPAAPSHGLCGSAGGLPSQSPNGDSLPRRGSQVSPPPLGAAKKFCPAPRRKKRHPAAPDVLFLL